MNNSRPFINIRLLEFAAYLGNKYGARVTSWGRDGRGNKAVGGLDNSWHLWERGGNAIDLKPHFKKAVAAMANEAKKAGFQVAVYGGFLHIEEPW